MDNQTENPDPLQDTNIVLPDWATREAQANLYAFGSPDGLGISRLRRLENALQFKRRGLIVQSDSDFAAIPIDVLNSAGQVALSGGDVQKLGSLPPFVADGQFAATATTTSITWYWDGTNGSMAFVMRRADGTNFSVPRGSITASGLTANTLYYFYPYLSVIAGCSIGWIVGTDGSPKIAFTAVSGTALAAQNRQDREAMTSGPMTYTTPAAGSSSGAGGGGGGAGKCVMQGTDIETLEDWEHNQEISQETEWIRLTANGRSLCCTKDHPIYVASGEKCQAQYLSIGDLVTMPDGDFPLEAKEEFLQTCTKIKVVMKKGHLFWANGFLCHNSKLAVS